MAGVALIARFGGDADRLAERLELAAARYAEIGDAATPTTATLLRNKDGITAVFVWPEGTSLQPFRAFLTGSLDELGLPHPQVEHFRAADTAWSPHAPS